MRKGEKAWIFFWKRVEEIVTRRNERKKNYGTVVVPQPLTVDTVFAEVKRYLLDLACDSLLLLR